MGGVDFLTCSDKGLSTVSVFQEACACFERPLCRLHVFMQL